MLSGGFDTPFAAAQGYSTTGFRHLHLRVICLANHASVRARPRKNNGAGKPSPYSTIGFL